MVLSGRLAGEVSVPTANCERSWLNAGARLRDGAIGKKTLQEGGSEPFGCTSLGGGYGC